LAHAQDKPKLFGFLGYADPNSAKAYIGWMFDELRKLGWIEGRNLTVKYLYTQGDAGLTEALASKLVALKPDVLYTSNLAGALALQRRTREIPVVFSAVGDPVFHGLVKSLRQPGANITGFTADPSVEMQERRLQLLRECFPRMRRLAILINTAEKTSSASNLPHFRQSVAEAGMELIEVDVQKASDIEGAFARLRQHQPDVLWVLSSGVSFVNREKIFSLAKESRIPTMASNSLFGDAGSLVTHATPIEYLARAPMGYVDRILRGAKPADLPVQQPTKFEFVVNIKTAKVIAVTIPQSILLRADRVIE
jgi:putative ABC transport system substrate-binding protein